MKQTLFTNALIHTGRTESEIFSAMLVEKGLIRALFSAEEAADYAGKAKVVDLRVRHVYPCLINNGGRMVVIGSEHAEHALALLLLIICSCMFHFSVQKYCKMR